MLVNHATSDHFLVSTDATVPIEDAEIALHWMDLTLYGIPGAAAALESINVRSICRPNTWTLTKSTGTRCFRNLRNWSQNQRRLHADGPSARAQKPGCAAHYP
ncbi:MAG: hypothetical protein OEZ06_10935 [Myxococcales bacterium]|nr:hypothetical protein [Myxococcales bacterium]